MFKSIAICLSLLCCNLALKAQANFGNGGATGNITACFGMASVSPYIQQFTVKGGGLTTPMTVYAAAYFELSLNPLYGYSSSVTITPVKGTINSTTVYARSAANAPAGPLTGQCQITTSGFSSNTPYLSATIYTLPVVNTVPNQVLLSGSVTQPVTFTGNGNTYTWTNDTPAIGLATAGDGNIASFTAVNTGNSPVTATISATATVAGFAYIPNSGDGTVSVVNTLTNKVVGTIQVGSQPDNITLTSSGSTAYVSNYGSGTISVIDTKTNTVVSTIQTGSGPAGMSLTADSSALYVTNENDNTLGFVFNGANNEDGTFAVGAAPVNTLCSPSGAFVFVANSGSGTITVFDLVGNSNTTLPVGQHPVGMVLSPNETTLYVANTNSNSLSEVSVLYNEVNTIPLTGPGGPAYMAASNDGSLLYITNPAAGTVLVFNTLTLTVDATIPVGQLPEGIDLSNDGSTLYVANSGSNSVSVISTATNSVTATIPVGTTPIAAGNFLKQATGCQSTVAKFTITVNPPTYPTIIPGGVPSALTTIYGTASAATTFSVTGMNMTTAILVTPPAGFEVSTDSVNFAATATIGAAGNIAATTVYIRLAATTPVGNYTGNIVLSGAPAESIDIIMPQSAVTPAPLTITADNKSKLFGSPNPPLTYTCIGFVNDDTPETLTPQPQLSTTAVTTSPAGEYPIMVTGAGSPNYTITYIPGVLTVSPPLFIPNTFTPNGDGINDTWVIDRLSSFTNCTVAVYSRYGQMVYSSTGYPAPWNGARNGAVLPTGTYYYLIDLKNGGPLLSGFVLIVR